MVKYLKLCLFCLLLIGCSKKEVIYEDKSNDFLNIKENNIEVYEDINLLDIIEIKDSNLKIITSNYKIGEIVVKSNDRLINSFDILTTNSIQKKSILQYILEFLCDYTSYFESFY